MKPESLYIHIPFCIRKCIYCDFLSVSYDEALSEKYIGALCRELNLKKELAGMLKTIYIGGGTPSVLSGESFNKLFKCLKDNFEFSPSIEITVEANPGTLDKSKIDLMLSLGINRLSIGVQSFNNDELRTLGRIHTAEEAAKSIEAVKEAGVKNFSLDLIYGIPGQTIKTWGESLTKAVGFSTAHISSYELTPENNTPLYGLIESSKITMPSEDLILEMYAHAIDYLAVHGYEHYEISNFASVFKCLHNLNYWDRGEYISAGAGAHSFINGERSKNTGDINRYIEELSNGAIPETESTEISCEDSMKEFIFLNMRKTEGISISRAEGLGLNIPDACRELIAEGYIGIKGDYIRLTRKGIVISNEIIVKMFEGLKLDCRHSPGNG